MKQTLLYLFCWRLLWSAFRLKKIGKGPVAFSLTD
jgi:hypothetical protein